MLPDNVIYIHFYMIAFFSSLLWISVNDNNNTLEHLRCRSVDGLGLWVTLWIRWWHFKLHVASKINNFLKLHEYNFFFFFATVYWKVNILFKTLFCDERVSCFQLLVLLSHVEHIALVLVMTEVCHSVNDLEEDGGLMMMKMHIDIKCY